MEFWGIEVKPGETVKCEPGDDKYLHLSQASLGEVKKEKDNENIPIHLKVDNQKLVIGTLSADKCPQITYDLVFEKEFELSHSWKDGSVFFVGYKTEVSDEGYPFTSFLLFSLITPDDFSEETDSESEEEEIPMLVPANGILLAVVQSSMDMLDGEGDSSDEDDEEDESSEEENEPSPKKDEIGKKRAAESALKTPASNKRAKLAVPGSGQKTGGHTATPHPAKQAGKTPATSDKSKQQTPKSAGSVPCKSCSKTFKDDNALQAHTKAKHSGN
ncbi:hypothetical protein Taro_027231 [Colocasia esculenta]|uniref:C2H2-type domain-containing protein n=1 Tax=Colocasia esculenta TaxID=4460 RepID=A0A843VLV4_COLES|nr:hypothetical protein [Colocasia esculenta]